MKRNYVLRKLGLRTEERKITHKSKGFKIKIDFALIEKKMI